MKGFSPAGTAAVALLLVLTGGAVPGAARAGEAPAEIEKALSKTVSVDFVDQPQEGCLKYIQGLTGIALSFEDLPAAEKQRAITLCLRNVPTGAVLDWVLQLGGCRREFREGAVRIAPRKAGEPGPALPIPDKIGRKRLAEWEAPPELSAEERTAVAKRIAELSSQDFAVRETASKALAAKGGAVRPLVEAALKSGDPEVAARAKSVLEEVRLAALAEAYGGFARTFEQQAAKRIKFDFVGSQADGVLDFLGRCSDINMVVDPACGAGGRKVTLLAEDSSVKAALDDILEQAGLRREFGKGAIWITKAEAAPAKPAAAPDIRTKVVDVRCIPGLVALGAGSKGGVKEGMIFLIRRNDDLVGKVQITQVEEDLSAGKIIGDPKLIKPGDDAMSTRASSPEVEEPKPKPPAP